ncbi:hypothetical protein BT63DRAFT_192987 [Microthyrium microscopicum]|uniref:Uncharacterized protein n=1 Tax=Microthyrium microscopicum TaxID=703497 RepID=A0A6A6UN06_9PEZI|nr:hypothetical protein BT63DRAFT_192987 [Microthyrium microscopicum]
MTEHCGSSHHNSSSKLQEYTSIPILKILLSIMHSTVVNRLLMALLFIGVTLAYPTDLTRRGQPFCGELAPCTPDCLCSSKK